MRPILLLALLAACPADRPDEGDDAGAGEGGGEGEGEGEGDIELDDGFFPTPLRIACRSAGCFDDVVFCRDGRARVGVGDDEFAGFYLRDGDRVTVDYDGVTDVFVAGDDGYVRQRDGAEFVNELVDPAVCEEF